MVEALERHPRTIRLSPRQKEILQAIADGLTHQQTGQRLDIRPNTVRSHRTIIEKKGGEVGEETRYIKLIKDGILNGNLVNNHPPHPLIPLTPREQDVMQCLYDEKTREQACKELYIESNTLRSHLRRIFKKYEVNNLFAAIAMHAGIIKEQNSS